jgi:hypothetical protein
MSDLTDSETTAHSNGSSRTTRSAADAAFLRAHGPLPPGPSCPISWQPNALAPVFHGVHEYGTLDGAPSRLRVFYPSLDASPSSAAALEGCGRYPVILFAHGQCEGDAFHYRKWTRLPAQLARSGYVVAVPELPMGAHPSQNSRAQHRIMAVLDWIRQRWDHRETLMPAATGLAGHSYGALL